MFIVIKIHYGWVDIVVGTSCRLLDQGDWADGVLYRQIRAALHSQALVLMGVCNHPNNSWRNSTTSHKQSRKFLDCVDNNFKWQRSQWGEVLCWTLFFLKRRNWWGMWILRAAWASVTMKWWNFRAVRKRTESSLSRTSGKQTWTFSRTCLG